MADITDVRGFGSARRAPYLSILLFYLRQC
jgi:hypothetical protein